jgi:hypothetical protein
MSVRDGRQLVFPALFATALLAACGDKPATPRAYVNAGLTASSAAAGQCNFNSTQQIMLIGHNDTTKPITDSNPLRINDGSQEAGSVHIDCTVHASGSGFNIRISSSVQNAIAGGGGSMTISGNVSCTPSMNGCEPQGGTGLHGTFAQGGIQYDDTNCSLSYTYGGNPILLQGPSATQHAPQVAPGRIWGHVDCPMAATSTGQMFTCDANADFVFENCSQ